MAKTYRKFELTLEFLEQAQERAASLPIYDYSHRQRQANLVGCIGELVFELFLEKNGIRFQDKREQTDHDYLVNETVTVDVKTKERTVVPMAHYDNSVPLYNHGHQRPDYYYFVSLLADREFEKDKLGRFKTAFLLGGIDLGTLDRDGVHWNAGQTDPRNGTTFWTACVNIEMEQLISNTDLLKLWKRSR